MLRLSVFAALWPTTDAGVNLQDPKPLQEHFSRTLKDYKPLAWDTITQKTAAAPMRVKNMQDTEFQDLVRRGYTIIVEDCIPLDSTLASTGCSEYARRFPNEHMKAEYTPGQAHVNLGDDSWHKTSAKTVKAKKHLSKGKTLSGAYVWHVKDETVSKTTKPELMNTFHVPYFLNNTEINRNEVMDSFEMWFTQEGGGAQAHADAYCETTISAQLRGKKTWRYGTFPNISNAFESYGFHDGDIYREPNEYWEPEHEHIVHPGECVIFPMGLIHETLVKEGDGGDETCTVASTFQFQDPQPVHLWKNFLTRWGLSHYTMDEPCLQRMEPYVFLGGRIGKGSEGDKLKEQISKIYRGVDADKDGIITRDELLKVYTKIGFQPPWTEMRDKKILKKARQEKADFHAEDALQYHDNNQDGVISSVEFEESVTRFALIKNRAAYIKSLRKAKKKDELLIKEREFIGNHLCQKNADDCPQLKQLEKNFGGQPGGRRHHEGGPPPLPPTHGVEL